MIFYSTPGSITWGKSESQCVTFQGEWTLEPKFYLDIPKEIFWNNIHPPKRLSEFELQEAIESLMADSIAKGWVIEIQR